MPCNVNSLVRTQLPSAQRANSMNVSCSFFFFGMEAALAFRGIMFYATQETATFKPSQACFVLATQVKRIKRAQAQRPFGY